MADDAASGVSPKQRKGQFSLRTLLELTVVAACLATWASWGLQRWSRGADGDLLCGSLALPKLVSQAASNIRLVNHGDSHGGGWGRATREESDSWMVQLPSESSSAFLHHLHEATVRRLSELGAETRQSDVCGWGDSGDATPLGAGGKIVYQFGGVRGVILLRVVHIPASNGSVWLTADHVQFR